MVKTAGLKMGGKTAGEHVKRRAQEKALEATQLARRFAERLRGPQESIRDAVRTSAQRMQTELDRALLGLQHTGAAAILERVAEKVDPILESESADLALRLGRNVLRRAQEIRSTLVGFAPSALVDFAPSAFKAKGAEAPVAGAPAAGMPPAEHEPLEEQLELKPAAAQTAAAKKLKVTKRAKAASKTPIKEAGKAVTKAGGKRKGAGVRGPAHA